jgi:hypothetical protein
VNAGDITESLASILRGDGMPRGGLDAPVEAILAVAEDHGVLPLVAAALPQLSQAPRVLAAEAARRAQEYVGADLVAEVELRAVLAALHTSGVDPVLIKGGHLAYTHYPRPDLRPRFDTDLLIAPDALPGTDGVLTGMGYTSQPSVGEDIVMSQRCYTKRGSGGQRHLVDVHWKLANSPVFADLVSYAELAREAVPVASLGPSARGLSPVHAMLVACVHRIAHHFDAGNLIWLYDVRLLAAGLDERDWDRFIDLAANRRVAGVCRTSLERAVNRLRAPVPPRVLEELGRRSAARREIAAGYLAPRRSRAATLVDELRALPTWPARWRLVREHLYPEASYMREVYAPASSAPLPLLRVRRVMRGAWKWLVRP